MQRGGLVTKPTLALIGEAGPELVVPMDAVHGGVSAAAGATMLSSASAASAQAQGGGNITFYNTFPNATLTSQKDAETLMLKAGYKAVDVMRRAGLLTG